MGILLKLEQLAKPLEMLVELVSLGSVRLVEPMRRDAELRRPMHLGGPDLDFIQLAARTKNRGVQRLVPVGLRAGDVVLDPVLHGRPRVMEDTQDMVARRNVRHDDPEGHHVVDLIERQPPLAHLLVDRPEVLRATGHVGMLDPGLGELTLEGASQGFDHRLAFGPFRGDLAGKAGVLLRLEKLECQILELRFDFCHPESVGQRGVDLARFGGNPLLPLGREVLQRPHVVESIGQLDNDDAGVLGNRQQQFAVILGLFLGPAPKGQVGNFGQALDQLSDLGPEFRREVVDADFRIFNDIVEQRGRDRGRVEKLIDENGRDRDAVRDELFARHPLLTPMGRRAEGQRPVDQRDVEPLRVLGKRGAKVGNRVKRRSSHSSPWVAKLIHRSPATMTWSRTGMPITAPAATNCPVIARSSGDGVGSPLG